MNAFITIILLVCSNAFMTFAWYGHLKGYTTKPILLVVLVSWFIAFFEYILQVPANRIGFTQAHFTLAQLKIIQEVISLAVFVVFAVSYMNQKMSLNYLWACFCILAAVYFIFKAN